MKKLEEHTANNLVRLIKYFVILIIVSALVIQFAEAIGFITALFSLVAGTVIGFAAMNTLGNAIAGLIIMISRPINVGDRINYEGKIVDVIEIKLIYTVMEDLDGVEIYLSNQKLLSGDIINYRKEGNIIRRQVSVTPGFDVPRGKVEEALLEAAKKVPAVLEAPEPYVWITAFQNYAVEHTLFVFIKDIKHLPIIDSDLHKAVLDTCIDFNIDISTPLLLHQVD